MEAMRGCIPGSREWQPASTRGEYPQAWSTRLNRRKRDPRPCGSRIGYPCGGGQGAPERGMIEALSARDPIVSRVHVKCQQDNVKILYNMCSETQARPLLNAVRVPSRHGTCVYTRRPWD